MKKLAFLAATLVALGTLVGSAAAIQDENESRMVGGGWMDNPDLAPNPTIKVREGMVLHCVVTLPGNNLEITWPAGNSFHLTQLNSASCNRNVPGVDDGGTITGSGEGRCNGEHAYVSFTFIDQPPTTRVPDTADVSVEGDDPGLCSLSTPGLLSLLGGNFTFIDDPDI